MLKHTVGITKSIFSNKYYHAIANYMLEPAISVEVVPQLSDNFSYIIRDEANLNSFVVDSSDGPSSLSALKKEDSCELMAVLTTHKHW